MGGPFDNGGLGIQAIPGVAGEGPNMTGTSLGTSELMQMLRGLTSDPSRLIQNQSVIPQGGLQPLPKRIYPEMQQSSNREFTTSGGHKRASMMDLGANIASMIKSANQNIENKKARDLSVDIERVMIAAQNPNDPQNQQVLKDIMSDPKKVKSLSEALNINLMGEEDKRKPHQKAAVQMAEQKLSKQQQKEQQQQQFQQGAPNRVQQLLKSLPSAAMLSPYAQAIMTLTKEGVIPKGSDVLSAQTKLDTQESREQIAKLIVGGQLNKAQIEAMARVQSSGDYAKSREYVADVTAKARKYAADKAYDAAMARTNEIEKRLTTIKTGQNRQLDQLAKQIQENVAATKQAADQLKQTPDSWWHTPKARTEGLQRIKFLQQQYDQLNKQFSQMLLMQQGNLSGASITTGDTNANTGSGAGAGGADQPQDNTNAPDELDKLIDQESQSIFGDSD